MQDLDIFVFLQRLGRLGKKHFLWTFDGKKTRKLQQIWNRDKLRESNIKPKCIFSFLLTGTTWYYHTIYLVFIYFASFTKYKDDIFEGISIFHVQGSKFGKKNYKFGRKSKKKLNSTEFMEFVFSKSALTSQDYKLNRLFSMLDNLAFS